MSNKTKNSDIRIIVIAIIVIAVVGVAAVAGIIASKNKNSENLLAELTELQKRAVTLVNSAEKPYEQGSIDEDEHNEILNLKDLADEAIDAVNSGDFDKDDINDKISVIKSGLETYENLLATLSGVDKDTEEYCEYVLDAADKLMVYMQKALDDGTITQERMDEFTALYDEIKEIKESPEKSDNLRLKEILQKLAVMGSQVGAPAELMDILTEYDGDDTTVTTEAQSENTTVAVEAEVEETTKAELSNNVSALIDSVTDFQNECSRKHDMGEITEEQYVDILQLEIEAAQIKEEMEKGGNTEDLDQKADELKTKLYDKAVEVGSQYADNFK
jgi:hypothetical protein